MLLLALVLSWTCARVRGGVVPPSWADPRHNPCAAQPGGWQLLLWPADGRCYRIFRRGHPCPPTMELSPGVGVSGAPGCRCPPGSAQSARDALCHQLLEQGPCPTGQYFAPVPAQPSPDRAPHQWGACREPDECPDGQVYWARDGRCYPRLSRGPCYRGELLVDGGGGLGVCRCESRGELGRYYSPLTKTCHEHYTPGPCQEKGQLFLPGGQCGCSAELPHYHPGTGSCYQIDTVGPCPLGHRFSPPAGGRSGRALCQCKDGHVPWEGPACYRPWTRGPCEAGHLLAANSTCAPLPCHTGRLYFPENGACYKVGVRGPCPKGQVVLFETAVRPAVEGISYRGMCGCSGPTAKTSTNDISSKASDDNRCAVGEETTARDIAGGKTDSTNPRIGCDAKAGSVFFDGTCHTLYSQGPCPHGQWLVPERRAKEGRSTWSGRGEELRLWSDSGTVQSKAMARCDCRPGYKATNRSNGTESSLLECQPPTVVLASFLNTHGLIGS